MITAWGRRSLLTTFAILALCDGASAAEGADTLRRWLDVLAFGAPVTVRATEENAAEGTVVLSDVAIGGPQSPVRITIPTLTAIDPRVTRTGDFAAHAVTFDRIEATIRVDFAALVAVPPSSPTAEELKPFTLRWNSGTLLAERLVMPLQGPAAAPADDVVARFLAIARWSSRLRADWMEVSDLTLSSAPAPDVETTLHYDLVFAAGIHEGRTERFGANGYRQTDRMNGTEQVTETATTTGVGLDNGAILEALDPAAYVGGKGDGRWRPVLRQYRQEGVSSTMDGVIVRMDALETTGVRVRQTERPILAVLGAVLADPARAERDPMGLARDLVPSVLGFWGVDRVAMDGISVEAPGIKTLALASVEATGLDSAGIGDLTLGGFELALEDGTGGRFGQITLGDLVFGDITAFFTLAEAGEEPAPEAVMAAALDGAPRLGFFEITSASADTPVGPVSVDTLAVTSGDYLKAMPRRSDLTFTNLDLPRGVFGDPAVVEALGSMGYETVTLSAGMTVDWDTDAARLAVEDVTVRAGEIGVLSFDALVSGLPLDILAPRPDGRPPYADAALVSATARFGNLSIVEKVFALKAKEMNQPPDAFRRNFAGALPLMLGFVGDKAVQDRVAGPLKAFLEDPQSLTLALRPTAPLPFTAMEAMAADGFGPLASALGFTLTSP